MAFLFLLMAMIAAVFALPGGRRSGADRRLSQLIAIVAAGAALAAIGLKPLGVGALAVGVVLFGIGWLKDRMTREGFQDLDEGRAPGARARPPAPRAGELSEGEALSILGLSPGADRGDILAAHRRLIAAAHPDRGGSSYLAAKINAARDRLVRDDRL
ncbi:hypothetical protein PB2503_12724 [Parvularcula bermudensis HTCC2503]|uniref:J domain-containing protein n=1 Tax=Parvularcula bermudensis (strain ATCC BAA-594 / HTCC2503 / KCTC 12087) TaxID=314260 RepID=E0TFM2_PARBH|nr:hypothetical protein [Parvularcula bermudensis]ADM10582.1 hypothetical protein PB2503_12724 [Parvularcula bermudensis HTCC2503]